MASVQLELPQRLGKQTRLCGFSAPTSSHSVSRNSASCLTLTQRPLYQISPFGNLSSPLFIGVNESIPLYPEVGAFILSLSCDACVLQTKSETKPMPGCPELPHLTHQVTPPLPLLSPSHLKLPCLEHWKGRGS